MNVRRYIPHAVMLLAILGFFSAIPIAVKAGYTPDNPEPDPAIAAAARHAYSEKQGAKYDFRFGKELPFLPSNAQTDNGEFIDPKSFPTAQY